MDQTLSDLTAKGGDIRIVGKWWPIGIFNRLAGRYGACMGIPTTIYLFAQMPGKFSTVRVWKCHPDFGIRDFGIRESGQSRRC